MRVSEDILNKIAELEQQALIDGLQNEEIRYNPKFLANVRTFMKDNQLLVDPTPVLLVADQTPRKELPIFEDIEE